jgi:hypothetical protein
LILAAVILAAEQLKGNDMDQGKTTMRAKANAKAKRGKAKTKTIATKGKDYSRKYAGQCLLVLAAMGSSMTAGAAGQQLLRDRRGDALRSLSFARVA